MISQDMEGGICRVILGYPIRSHIKENQLERYAKDSLVQVELHGKQDIKPLVLFSLLELLPKPVIVEVEDVPPSEAGTSFHQEG